MNLIRKRVLIFSFSLLFLSTCIAVPQSTATTQEVGGKSTIEPKKPAADYSWTAWYKDPRPNHGPEYHASAVGTDQNIAAAGTCANFAADPETSELMVGKYSPDGQLRKGWPRFYSHPGFRWNEGQDVVVDASGDITVAGYIITDDNVWYLAIWRLNSSGKFLSGWPQYLKVDDHSFGTGVVIEPSGDITACGYSLYSEPGIWKSRIILVKYRNNGSRVPGWPKAYQVAPGQDSVAYGLTQDSDGNLIVAGDTGTFWPLPGGPLDAVLYKLDRNGKVISGWPKVWGSRIGKNDEYYSVSQDTNGNYCVVGASQDSSSIYHLLVTRYSRAGKQLTSYGWPKIYKPNSILEYHPPDAWHGSVDTKGDIAAACSTEIPAQVRTVKYNRSGAMFDGYPKSLGKKDYRTVTRSCDVDDMDNVYVVGYAARNANPLGDYYTFLTKYPPTKPAGAKTWYLAEGSTGANDKGSFETWVLVQNPGDKVANVQLYYQTPTGEVKGHAITLQPHRRETRNVADFVKNEFSVSTRVVSSNPVIAERAMYWASSEGIYRQAAHDSIGVTEAAKTWYLAEGSTGANDKGSFETWVLVQNPGDKVANVQLYYQTPTGEVKGHAITLQPHRRETRNVADFVKNEFSVSTRVVSSNPVIAERAMYWASSEGIYRQAAHDSIGVTEAAKTWYLAEGSTGANDKGSFETWVLVQNPGDKVANVQLYYQTPTGEVKGHAITLQPHRRETRNVADFVKNEFSVSTRVVSSNPVIAERAMYWASSKGIYRQAAHDSIGVTEAAKTWYLAEGSTGANDKGSFETWVLVQNPGDKVANVQLYYQTPTGEVKGHAITLQPHRRETRNVADFVKNEFSVSTRVVSSNPVIAERAMYWASSEGIYRQAAHDSIGFDP